MSASKHVGNKTAEAKTLWLCQPPRLPNPITSGEAHQLEQVLYSCITAYLFANVCQIVPH